MYQLTFIEEDPGFISIRDKNGVKIAEAIEYYFPCNLYEVYDCKGHWIITVLSKSELKRNIQTQVESLIEIAYLQKK